MDENKVVLRTYFIHGELPLKQDITLIKIVEVEFSKMKILQRYLIEKALRSINETVISWIQIGCFRHSDLFLISSIEQ